jgi:hypothetical protein
VFFFLFDKILSSTESLEAMINPASKRLSNAMHDVSRKRCRCLRYQEGEEKLAS